MDNPGKHDAHHTIRTVSVGTGWRVLRYPFILLSMAIIPRAMGDQIYGQYAFFMSVFIVFDCLTDLGTTQIFGRFVPECEASGERGRSTRLLHAVLYYNLLLTLVVCLVMIAAPLIHPFKGFSFSWFFLMALLLWFTKIEGILFGFVYGLNHIARFSAKEVMRSAFTFALVLVLYLRFGLTGAFWGLILNEIILAGIVIAWTGPHLFRPVEPIRFNEIKPFVLFGIQFYIPLFLFGLLQRSGNVFIQWLTSSSEQVAYFDIANQFLLLMATFLGLILSTLLPSLSALHAQGRQDIIHRYHSVSMAFCAVVIFLAFNALAWFGREAIVRLLGPSFSPVFPNALVMVLAVFPIVIAYAGINYSILEKRAGIYTAAVLAGLLVMVAGFMALIPRWSSIGATWAMVAGYVVLAAVFYRRYRSEFAAAFGDFWKAAGVGALFAPLCLIKAGLVVSILAFCATSALYIVALFLLHIVRWSDIRKVVNAFRGGNGRNVEEASGRFD
jgi:O-antigen/teichoic acid export membrane protein